MHRFREKLLHVLLVRRFPLRASKQVITCAPIVEHGRFEDPPEPCLSQVCARVLQKLVLRVPFLLG